MLRSKRRGRVHCWAASQESRKAGGQPGRERGREALTVEWGRRSLDGREAMCSDQWAGGTKHLERIDERNESEHVD